MIDVSYGILNYNPGNDPVAKKHFLACVASLMENKSDALTSEVYLINQGGPEEQGELVRYSAKTYGIQAICLANNVGISRGINLLANMARGKYISLVTSDTVFPKGLDTHLIDTLSKYPNMYQICPASNISDIPYQRTPELGMRSELMQCIAQELTIQFWPRTTFEKIGYFDEQWKAQYENLDFATRIFIDGGFAVVDKRVSCDHVHNMTTKNGSIGSAYDGYIQREAIDKNILRSMWNQKWPGLSWDILYRPFDLNEGLRQELRNTYSHNIYLPYIQNVSY